MFTGAEYLGRIPEVAADIIAAFEADGLRAPLDRHGPNFARIQVSDGRSASKVELVADRRRHEPVRLSIGPVLHLDDAVANKVSAMYDRYEARDFIDVAGALQSGRYDHDTLITLLHGVQAGVTPDLLADSLAWASRHTDAAYAEYGITDRDLDDLRARFADWRAELLGART